MAEEYLSDHFPTFPVLPGVLTLQAMAEAAAWLVRDAHGFEPDVILLREAKNVTYKGFVRPGQLLKVEVTCRRLARGESDFSGVGSCDVGEVVKGRFGLTHFSLSDRVGISDCSADAMVASERARFARLRGE